MPFADLHTLPFRFAPESCQRILSYISGYVSLPLRCRCSILILTQLDIYNCMASRERPGHVPGRQSHPDHDPTQRRQLRLPVLPRDPPRFHGCSDCIHRRRLRRPSAALLAERGIHRACASIPRVYNSCMGFISRGISQTGLDRVRE